jgi:hypothetical protein
VGVGLTLVATVGVNTATPAATRDLVHAMDVADAVKLVLLAGFVAAATALAARAGVVRRWLRVVAAALVMLVWAARSPTRWGGTACADRRRLTAGNTRHTFGSERPRR